MTKTIINIKADRYVKKKAQKVARDLGMPLSTIINAYLNQFVRTKEVHFYMEGELRPSVKKRLERLQKEALGNKNLSKIFYGAKGVDDYLNSFGK